MKIKMLFIILFFPLYFHAQYFELGGSLGASNYLGDLAPSGLKTSIGQTNWAKGIFVRYNIYDFFALRFDLTQGMISASDKFSKEGDSRKMRNLSFRSKIYEAAILGEINILGFQPEGNHKPFSPYIFGGIAFFKFNPQAKLNNQWYDLQPLGTEGQGLAEHPEKYALTQFSIPLGAGLKIALNKNFTMAFECGTRKTSTDYLDDVSSSYPDLENLAIANGELAAKLSWRYDELNEYATPPTQGSERGDPDDLDWYIFSKMTISYNFIDGKKKSRNGKKRKKKNSIKCPDF
ncbi:MAG: DUF6089 family protein [Saprospiraceae bacterium]